VTSHDPDRDEPPTEPKPGAPRTDPGSEEPELSLDDARMSAWLDRQLGPLEERDFEAKLAADPARQKEALTLAQVLATLRELPREEAPKELLDDVRSDISNKSRGRYFGYHWKYRFPYEALFAALISIVAVVVYVLAQPSPPRLIPVEAKTFLVSGSDLGVGARILSDYGIFRRDPEAPAESLWVHLVGEVSAARIEALHTELSLYPSMRIDGEEVVGDVVKVRVALRRSAP
jgi:hypothetical protein